MKTYTVNSVTKKIRSTEETDAARINYTFEHVEGNPPAIISFSASRKDNGYGNSIITGDYTTSDNKFRINNRDMSNEDFAIQEDIFSRCLQIVQDLTEPGEGGEEGQEE